ncbi:unnamed protein product [Zymoseptoria tritici ST99CH_1E4]|uniref:Uncharacterized protein n=1 Tax=Zymoseptoria tritici ST99CH_1E4 TaxID=1276532 RepID=A0A2H1G4H2_ZYMTR|nr:unnamed protein product [Zymoseptoria tritici ST99CH_1E4]
MPPKRKATLNTPPESDERPRQHAAGPSPTLITPKPKAKRRAKGQGKRRRKITPEEAAVLEAAAMTDRIQSNAQHRDRRLRGILNLPTELVQKIGDELIALGEENTKPLAVLEAHRYLEAMLAEQTIKQAVIPFTFDMSEYYPNSHRFSVEFHAMRDIFRRDIRFISFRITNLGLASIYSFGLIAYEFYRRYRMDHRKINPCKPVRLDTGLNKEERQILTTLNTRRRTTRALLETPSYLTALEYDKKAITVSFDVVQDFSNGDDLPPRLRRNLIDSLFQGVMWFGQQNDGRGMAISNLWVETKLYFAFKNGFGIPENFQTAFFWFAEVFLGGNAFFDPDVSFEKQQEKEVKVAMDREREKRRGGGNF